MVSPAYSFEQLKEICGQFEGEEAVRTLALRMRGDGPRPAGLAYMGEIAISPTGAIVICEAKSALAAKAAYRAIKEAGGEVYTARQIAVLRNAPRFDVGVGADWLETVTNAPKAYDGFGTLVVSELGLDDRGRVIRRVVTPPIHTEWQRGRYSSGLYLAADKALWADLAEALLAAPVAQKN